MRARCLLTDTMDVGHGRLRKVVVDYEIDALKVHAARQQLGRDEKPCPPGSKARHDCIPLGLRPLRVDHVDVDAIVHELVEKLLGALDRLHKH